MNTNANQPSPPTYDKNEWVLVVCRLCGSEWLYPKKYEKMFDAEHPLENCPYCRRNPMYQMRRVK